MEGKTALVTGGGRGIGRAIALAFAREGAAVAVLARTAEEVEWVAEEIRALGSDGVALVADVTSQQEVIAAVGALRERWPRLDVLVNNAGGGVERRSVLEGSVEGWLRTIEVNLLGSYRTLVACLPHLIERRGYWLQIASLAAFGHALDCFERMEVVAIHAAIADRNGFFNPGVRGHLQRRDAPCDGKAGTSQERESHGSRGVVHLLGPLPIP